MRSNNETDTNTLETATLNPQAAHQRIGRRTRLVLWSVQALLAALFLFAGGMKLILPLAALAKQSPMPGLFLRFIGLCEVAGALGLILPGLVRIRQGLTSLAAAGLVIIMIGATGATMATGQIAPAAFPFVVGLLAAFVAYGRRQPGARATSFVPAELQAA